MASQADIQSDELRDFVLALAECCPLDRCNPPDCPLYQLRKRKMAERLKWLQALDEDDVVYLTSYHYVCLTTKTEQLVAC